MYSVNLTLAGLLVTLPYIVMLIMLSRASTALVTQQTWILNCSEKATYNYCT